jgi:hypothetical protein
VGFGEDEVAVEWLERAATQPGALQFWLPTDPLWNRMRSHPGFQRVLAHWKQDAHT